MQMHYIMILALKLIAYFLSFLLGFSYNEADKGQIEAAIKYADINRYGLLCDFNIDEALKYYKKVHDHSEDARKSIFALEIKKEKKRNQWNQFMINNSYNLKKIYFLNFFFLLLLLKLFNEIIIN